VSSKSLEEWLKILWENEYVVCGVVCGAESPFVCSSPSPAAGGSPPLL
jgi:hypothetical protein